MWTRQGSRTGCGGRPFERNVTESLIEFLTAGADTARERHHSQIDAGVLANVPIRVMT